MTPDAPLPKMTYHRRCAEFGTRRDFFQRRSDRLGNLNLAVLATGLVCLGLGLWRGQSLFYALAGARLGLGFVVLFVWHDRVDRCLRRYRLLYEINNDGLLRLRHDWGRLPLARRGQEGDQETDEPPGLDPGTAADLDLLGHASLEHLLATSHTPVGQAAVRRWILSPAAPETARARQAAVAELAPLVDFRDEVSVRGRLMGDAQAGYERFIAWAEGPGWLRKRPGLLWAARALPLLTLGLLLAQWRGVAVSSVLAAVVLAELALVAVYGRAVQHEIDQVAERRAVLEAYAAIFRLISGQVFAADDLRRLQRRLFAGGVSADRQMRRLGRLMPLVDIRRAMGFFVVEVATLWSFQVLWLLERWQAQAGAEVRRWLGALGEVEALIALGALCHDHPGWAFPEFVDGPPHVVARQLAHPLLPPDGAVANDVTVGPPGTFLLVTGSNMSGKSTLLRAIGVNTVLAQMGGPVCAGAMRLPSLMVASSMRVQDSLQQGVSYFMAGLRSLKGIVDLADDPVRRDGQPLLYLLDEILQGTNTIERQVAARHIVLHLVRAGAIGAVSTHDLTLADSPAVAAASVPVHFAETIDGAGGTPEMAFDYRLRAGIATSTNALRLMQLIGLPTDDGDDAPR